MEKRVNEATNRRGFLGKALKLGAGVVGAGAIGTGIYSLVQEDELDLKFLEDVEKKREPLFQLGQSRMVSSIDEEAQGALFKHINTDAKIQTEWYSNGGKKQIEKVKINEIIERDLFSTELNKPLAESYANYCKKSMNYTLEKCKIDCEPLPIKIVEDNKFENFDFAGIINHLWKHTELDFSLIQEDKKLVTSKLYLTQDLNIAGKISIAYDFDKATGLFQYYIVSPLLLATGHGTYIRCESPIAEQLHWTLRDTTFKATSAEITDPDNWLTVAKDWLRVEEAVVHAVTHKILEDLISKYNLPLTISDYKTRIEQQENSEQLKLVKKSIPLVQKEGIGLINEYIKDPFAVRRKLER